jgi:peptidoglycan/LPS O-acetylase OafA/YrhL
MQPKKLDFIDTLRGLASLYVLVYHLSLITVPNAVAPDWLAPFVALGGSGVNLFFIVSAFTLCLSMESRHTGQAEPVANFYLRRVFRIAPLFYLWLVVYYFRDIWYYHFIHPPGVVAESVLFVFNLIPGQEQGYVWASWTIGVEMLFYVMFPHIFARARNIGMALALFLLSLMLRPPFYHFAIHTTKVTADAISYYNFSIFFNLGTFMFGIVVYRIYKMLNHEAALRYGAGYALIAFAAAFLMWQCYDPLPFDRGTGTFMQTLCFSALLLGLSLSPIKILVNRVTQFYGKISYSVYLSHATAVFFMSPIFAFIYARIANKTLDFGLSVALALAVVTPLSYATYRLVEQPGNALGRAIIRRRRNAAVAEAV